MRVIVNFPENVDTLERHYGDYAALMREKDEAKAYVPDYIALDESFVEPRPQNRE